MKSLSIMLMTAAVIFSGLGTVEALTGWGYQDERLGYVMELDPLPEGIEPSVIESVEIRDDSGYGSLDDLTVMEADSTGPVKGENYIKMYIESSPSTAGSDTDYIYMRFGYGYTIQLNGSSGSSGPFPLGATLTWDLNDVESYLEDVPQDAWDYISLVTPSSDGIKIERLIIEHSSQEILDWSVSDWLDKWDGTTMGLAAKILERKLDWVDDSTNASLHYGAREIGKTNGDKYGTSGAWCSEFASWCLQKAGFQSPTGSIGTTAMKDYFDDNNRLYTKSDVKNKTYVMTEGDYLSLFGGGHSAIFVEWIDSTDTITNDTRFRTLEGNTSGRVQRASRKVGNIDAVGRTE